MNPSDIEIAQSSAKQPILDIARSLDIPERFVEQYGSYKAKIDYNLLQDLSDKPDGKLILVTAISPTPANQLADCQRSERMTRRRSRHIRRTARSRRIAPPASSVHRASPNNRNSRSERPNSPIRWTP